VDTSRRIVTPLRHGGLTADEIAAKLKLTASAFAPNSPGWSATPSCSASVNARATPRRAVGLGGYRCGAAIVSREGRDVASSTTIV
jgi:hypothetical protein